MKILAIICEFNPFHNGHRYLIEQAKETTRCDAVLCIMSGSFTQRGEMCVLDKYTRAKHAVLSGADCVIQLPAAFAVAPAEIFAKGAIKVLSSIPDVSLLAFGCEHGSNQSFIRAAASLSDEPEKFKSILTDKLSEGESYIKSYAAAFTACGGDGNLITSPNNILGLEYAKAILNAKANIDIVPIKRIGSGYKDDAIKNNYSSASAIRANIDSTQIKSNVPKHVFEDLQNARKGDYEAALRHFLFNADINNMKRIYGCTEGLENKLKSLVNLPTDEIIKGATSRRYSSSRIRRILCANALELYRDDCEKYLNGGLYIKPLAVDKRKADDILSTLAKSSYPVVTGINDERLYETAKRCFATDANEFAFYNMLTGSDNKDYMIIV